jgi:hypothetical protein
MIFKAFVVPTPRRIRRYIEFVIDEFNTEIISSNNNLEKEDKRVVNIPDNNDLKNYGIKLRLF